MTSKLKQNLRYAKAAQKLLNKVYPEDGTERKLIKLNERYEDLSKTVAAVWQRMYAKGFQPMTDNGNPKFYCDFDELRAAERSQQRLSNTINRIEQHTGKSLDTALQRMYMLNAGRASQSF